MTQSLAKVLVSSCLLGERVRFDGRDKHLGDTRLQRWLAEGRVVPICPEVAGGLPVPREPAEIRDGRGGAAVLHGDGTVVDRAGRDVTAEFRRGAELAVALARTHGILVAVLKEGSPSCGTGRSYDGTFTRTSVPHPGVTAAALRAAGVAVFSEEQLGAAEVELRRGDAGRR